MDKRSIIEEISNGAETVIQLMQMGGHEIKIVARRKGQTIPADGDYVRVRVAVHLPTNENDELLVNSLQFGSRAQILGEWMYRDWGMLRDNMRINSETYYADTWREAATLGLDRVEKELNSLAEVIQERKDALIRAEG